MSATQTLGTWCPAWGLPAPLPSGPRRGCLAQSGTADGRGPHKASPPNPLNEAECGGCGWCQTWLSQHLPAHTPHCLAGTCPRGRCRGPPRGHRWLSVGAGDSGALAEAQGPPARDTTWGPQ